MSKIKRKSHKQSHRLQTQFHEKSIVLKIKTYNTLGNTRAKGDTLTVLMLMLHYLPRASSAAWYR